MSDFLTWRTDSYLLDDKPVVENEWLTTNKLIEKQVGSRIFLQSKILNLYSFIEKVLKEIKKDWNLILKKKENNE